MVRPGPAESLLVVEGLEVVYDGAILGVRGASLEVTAGRIVALLGPNGAGKSTTLKAISGLLPLDGGRKLAGSVRYGGEEVGDIDPRELVRRGVVQVLEGRHCFAHLTVDENLLTGALVHRPSARELARDVDRALAYFPRLAERRRSPAGLLSGGEQQMLAMARALLARPRLLLLDEPSMGLAPKLVDEVFRIVKALNENEGLTVLVAEQNATVALRYADYGHVLENGRVASSGPASVLRSRSDIRELYLGIGAGGRRRFRDATSAQPESRSEG